MRPQDIGFDEFCGYYQAEKELTQYVDKRRYPDLVLNPERLEMLRRTGASDGLYHGFKGGKTTQIEKVDSIEKMADPNTRRNFNDKVEQVGHSISDVTDATSAAIAAPLENAGLAKR